VAAGSTTTALSLGTSPGVLTGTDTFTAMGTFSDGKSRDLTATVGWNVQPSSGTAFSGATVSFSAPGTYTVVATSGGVASNPVTVEATFSGDFVCADLDTSGSCASVDPGSKTGLQGTPAGAVGIAYPLANALFPSNLGPMQVQISGQGTAARIAFRTSVTTNLNIDYYGACEAGPGGGCYVTIPPR
jgi:hypothetical protein